MALPRTLSKPIRARIENVVFQSAIIALVLNYLPRLSEYIPYGFSRQALSAIPLARKLLKILWGFAIVKNLSGIASHVALNSWKTNEWNDEQEIVVVTGGSSGIGALVVRGFAERGAKVAILDLQEPKESLGPNISFYKCDVTSSSEISKVATEVRSKFGDPTVLINNAGIGFAETILGGTEAHLRATMNVNLLSHFLMVKEYLPSMVKRNKGHVVTVASMASVVTIASNVDYSCTKAGVLAFHEGLRQELDYRYNARLVRTSIIHPTWVRTPLTAPMGGHSDELTKGILEPEVIADAIVSQVVSGYGGQIFCPPNLSLMSGIRGFPHWLQESIRGAQKNVLQL